MVSPRVRTFIIASLGVALPVFITGCGYKDDLYLPTPAADTPAAPAQAPATGDEPDPQAEKKPPADNSPPQE